jgi:5'-nucleotidase/UDP-sugar diphosphatase
MQIKVNERTIEIYAGARVRDVLRKYSHSEWTLVRNKEKKVTDSYGHEVGLDGELNDGEKLVIKRARSTGSALRLLLFALLGVSVLSSCAGGPSATSATSATTRPSPMTESTRSTQKTESTETRIVIFHTNDVHGKIDNFAKVAAIIDAERKKGEADVFFFSAGDNFTGDPVVDRYDPPGEPLRELFDRLGLDVLSPGNHEFDYGIAPLRKLAARFRTVSANIEARPGAFPELRPWVVLETKGGIRMVVFGLIQIEPGNGLPSTHPDKIRDLRFSEPLAKALELKKLRASGQVMIGLTHIGYEQDLLLAKQMPELDVIIGGHSHTRVDPAENINGVLVAQAGGDDMFLGRVDILLKDGRVIEKKGRLIDLSKMRDEDETIKALIAKFHQNPAFARVIAKAPLEISGKNALGSLMTDAICRIHGLDIAFQNNGGIRLNRLPLAITLKDVYTLDPFGNLIVQIDMTPAEIRTLIKSSFEKRHELDLQVSGISYTVLTDSTPQIKEIKLRNPGGSPLAEDRTYKVGLSSYIANSYGFDHKDPGRSLQTTTAEALIRFLESGVDLGIYRDVRRVFLEKAAASSRN